LNTHTVEDIFQGNIYLDQKHGRNKKIPGSFAQALTLQMAR
jgi:hypothetical protein